MRLHAPDFLGYESGIAMATEFPERVNMGLRLKKTGNDVMTLLGREIHPINLKIQERTTPLIYVANGDCYVVANARPAGERRNPWLYNLRAAGRARVRLGSLCLDVVARELDKEKIERWWPALVEAWPAFADHYEAFGEHTVLLLQPDPE